METHLMSVCLTKNKFRLSLLSHKGKLVLQQEHIGDNKHMDDNNNNNNNNV